MPWVNRSSAKNKHGLLDSCDDSGVSIGILIDYEQWGSTAAVVLIVEKEIAMTQPHIQAFGKRIGEMERRLTSDMSGTSGPSIIEAVEDRRPVAKGMARREGIISKTDAKT